MTQTIEVISRTQVIVVNPVSGSVAVINGGAVGPPGPAGEDGGDTLWSNDSGVLEPAVATLVNIFRFLAGESFSFKAQDGLNTYEIAYESGELKITCDDGTDSTYNFIRTGEIYLVASAAPNSAVLNLNALSGTCNFQLISGGTTFEISVSGNNMSIKAIGGFGHIGIDAETSVSINKIGFDEETSATTLGTVIGKYPIRSTGGSIIGYGPVYDDIT